MATGSWDSTVKVLYNLHYSQVYALYTYDIQYTYATAIEIGNHS